MGKRFSWHNEQRRRGIRCANVRAFSGSNVRLRGEQSTEEVLERKEEKREVYSN